MVLILNVHEIIYVYLKLFKIIINNDDRENQNKMILNLFYGQLWSVK